METTVRRLALYALISVAVAGIAACGGGGSGSSKSDLTDNNSIGEDEGDFLPASTFAQRCVAPRSGTDPYGNPYQDVQGTRLDENNWLRSMSNDLYLWYDEIEDRNPANYDDSLEYFDLLKTFALTPSGNEKDRFHFAVPTDEWNAQSQSGVFVGYGLQWAIIKATPPREVRVAYREVDQVAGQVLPPRGTLILEVNGWDLVNTTDPEHISEINEALFVSSPQQIHNFDVQYPDGTLANINLESASIEVDPVQNVHVIEASMGRRVGYMLFNDHIATAEPALINAVNELKSAEIDELVLDIRYNGGGYLYIASQLAYMIAGDVPTAGQPFEAITWNDKHPEIDPVTGAPLDPIPFFNETSDLSTVQPGLPLPSLDLPRVFVLTGENTCSASESIINSLRGVDVEVVQIGATTCGKPYGFYGLDNCGTTYLTIQFKGANAKGFGDYADGFIPAGNTGTDADVPGCPVGDDFAHLLGDVNEARLATAINVIETGSCGDVPATGYSRSLIGASLSTPSSARVAKEFWRNNRIMRR